MINKVLKLYFMIIIFIFLLIIKTLKLNKYFVYLSP